MDKAAAAQQIAAITASLETLTKDLKLYASAIENGSGTDLESIGKVSSTHTNLIASVRTLNRSARGPVDMVFAQIEAVAYTGAVRALVEMGIFEALPLDGTSLSADVLAEKLSVEKDLLVRLMRVVIPELFAEPKSQEYTHTPYSMVYLHPGIRGAFKLMLGEYTPVFNQLSEFFKTQGWKSPQDEHNNPYTFTHKTGDLTMWEHVKLDPVYFADWNAAMNAQGLATSFAISIFPFRSELSKLETTEESVLVVDVGGGLGHATMQIKGLIGDVKGKVILQDRKEVLEDIKEDLGAGIEKMPHDFFTPNPVKGAAIYYIRRCLHDWNDAKCIEILQNISCSMTKNSRLLIAEIVLPTTEVDVEGAWMDLTMMTFTGRERTEEQWVELLTAAGLKLEKTYGLAGTHHGVVEAYLK
ncbi:o-methyltransferas-like protein [Hyaloscypha variabilis F]|uniref:O-methyltransferas-like protein n=1 Tax=Hyaloscypha variabilis (strain UAMH 11265 / GT02V1 / F) TaxID=1149755 RepID=A0A2J6QSZ7_HYAVF|nr:o-methyltransferas-like protein [Hyaloscypha variabilis F]